MNKIRSNGKETVRLVRLHTSQICHLLLGLWLIMILLECNGANSKKQNTNSDHQVLRCPHVNLNLMFLTSMMSKPYPSTLIPKSLQSEFSPSILNAKRIKVAFQELKRIQWYKLPILLKFWVKRSHLLGIYLHWNHALQLSEVEFLVLNLRRNC